MFFAPVSSSCLGFGQYCDGLYGPLIVNKKVDALRPTLNGEFVVVLSDYFHASGTTMGTAVRPHPAIGCYAKPFCPRSGLTCTTSCRTRW